MDNNKQKKEMQDKERDERYVRRRQLKEAEEEDASASKKPRLDLLDKLKPTSSVFDILAASGSEPLHTLPEDHEVAMEALPTTLSEDQIINKEADTGNKAAGPLLALCFEPKEVPSSEDMEVAMKTTEGNAATLGEIFETATDEIATTGAEEASSESFPIGDESFQADSQAPLGAMDTSNTRSGKVYLSPALVWLEEEGLAAAEKEAKAMMKAVGVEVDEEEAERRALLKWKMMGSEEKAVWRKRAEEKANKKI